jgi:hypothetical protein
MTDEDRARAILMAEVEARLALRQTKAQRYLALVAEGMRHSEAQQRTLLDTVELERAWAVAFVERQLLIWDNARGRSDAGP